MSPSLLIYGDSSRRDEFVSEGVGIADIFEVNFVEVINRQVCRFAYQAVFAQKAGQDDLSRSTPGCPYSYVLTDLVLVKVRPLSLRWFSESESASQSWSTNRHSVRDLRLGVSEKIGVIA